MLYCPIWEAADEGEPVVPHWDPVEGGGGVLPHWDEGTLALGGRVIPPVDGTGDVLEGGGVMLAERVWLGGGALCDWRRLLLPGGYGNIQSYTEIYWVTGKYRIYSTCILINKLNIGILSYTEFYWVIQAYG